MVTVGKKTMPSIHMSCWILQSVATNNSLPFVVVQSVNMISFTFRSSASYIKRDCQHLNLIIPFVPNMRLTNHDKEETVRCAHLTKRDVANYVCFASSNSDLPSTYLHYLLGGTSDGEEVPPNK